MLFNPKTTCPGGERRSRSAELSPGFRLPRFGLAVVLLALAVLGWGPGCLFGQDAPPPVLPEKCPTTQQLAGDLGGVSVAQPAWGAGLEWSPHKPGLLLEPDCFVNAEAALVFPHLSSLLTAPVRLGENGPTRLLALRNADLGPTGSVLIQLGGFRFGPGYPELALTYRLMAAEGKESFARAAVPGAADLRSRLNLQTFSFDCLRRDCPLGQSAWLSWDAGALIQVVFFDTQLHAVGSFQQGRNYFFGAGPHAGVGLKRLLGNGVGFYGRFDAALVAGYNTARSFVLTTSDPNNGTLSGSAFRQETQLSPSFAVQAGLTWTPAGCPTATLRTGYQFEQWYNLGRVDTSRGDLNAHGLFLSLEVGF